MQTWFVGTKNRLVIGEYAAGCSSFGPSAAGQMPLEFTLSPLRRVEYLSTTSGRP